MRNGLCLARGRMVLRLLAAWGLCAASAIAGMYFSSIRLNKTDGKREFFVGSASSQGVRKTEISMFDIGKVGGESVYFETDGTKTPSEAAEEIAKAYGAEIIRTEYVCGVYAYYAYTPLWADGICIEGQWVNLHIAIEETGERGAVGTPILFGGY